MDQVEEVKQKTDIIGLIGEYIELKKAGRNYKALCPFHSEKSPSFMVSPELQSFKCFGCGESGDAYTFLEKYEGMDFPEALRFLAKRANVTLRQTQGREFSDKDILYQINNAAARFYNYLLLNHKVGAPALRYLMENRGIKRETIETFNLGYSPETPGALAKYLVGKKKFDIREVERAGLLILRDGKNFDRFRGRVIFPLYDHRGNIVGFAGRLMPGAGKDLAKYINTPETPIYHKGSTLYGINLTKRDIKDENKAIVVEGELDLISSWQAGVGNVVAIKGSALTEDQVRLLGRFTKDLILALDTDLAGDAAARRGIVVAQGEGMNLRVARFGKYKDPDEAARASAEEYKKFLEMAVGVWDFIVESVFAKNDASTGEGKAKISREIAPILGTIPDKIVQAHYIELVAKKLGVPVEAVADQVVSVEKKEEDKPKITEIVKPVQKSRRALLEERLLTIAFQIDPKILLDEALLKLVKTPLPARLLEEYKKFSETNTIFNPSEFSAGLPKELVSGFAELILGDFGEEDKKPEELARELKLIQSELRILDTRHRLEELGAKIRELEAAGEQAKLKIAQEKFEDLVQKLSLLERGEDRGIILSEG